MPGSAVTFKADIREYCAERFSPDATILDIGAGQGSYSMWLRDKFYNIDAIEIYTPYVDLFSLHDLYRNVFIADACEFNYTPYNVYILGDVLEHMLIGQAQKLLATLSALGGEIIVSVPYLTAQGAAMNNIYEVHLQPDLTKQIMLDRYGKWLKHWLSNHQIGVFLKND